MIPGLPTSGLWYRLICHRVAPTLLALVSSAGAPSMASAGLFDAHMFQLSNGMQVVLIPDHRAPVVTHMLWYLVGSADEIPGQSGLAHFFEHLMFKGTTTYPGDAYLRLIGRAGGEVNAFTSCDYTAYYATVGTESLDLVMALEADRRVNLMLTEETVQVERQVIVELREKRGLVYSVRTALESLSRESLLLAWFATENDKVAMAIELVRREWRRLASGDVSETDIDEAKAFLKGALPLSLDGTSTMARRLLTVQRLGLDIDHLTAWNAKVDAVTGEMVRALARRLMQPDTLTFTVAGDPPGM